MATSIGPYRFSDTDVRKTLGHGPELIDLVTSAGRNGVAARRARVAAAVDGVDAAHADMSTLVPLLERVWPELLGVHEDLAAATALPATAAGVVDHLAVSSGGVPKRSVERVDVDHGGVAGDRQATRVHHGRPWQALCLWSAEVLEALTDQGHPIGPGFAGENVTISGLDWATVEPGVRLRLGEVLCQVSSYAVPCSQNAQWFSDGNFGRIHHDRGPVSRVYATVLEPGAIALADQAIIEPG